MSRAQPSSNNILHIAEFIAIVVVSFVFGAVAFYRVLGALAIIHGIAMMWSRSVPVGIEGREPSFYLKGSSAIFAGLAVAALGAALAWFAPEVVCVFSEGRQCP